MSCAWSPEEESILQELIAEWRARHEAIWNGGSCEEPPTVPAPTDTRAGTPERVLVYQQRAAAGYAVFHPDDFRLGGGDSHMCKELCELREDGEMQSCQDCGCLICWDVEVGDDVIQPAYATMSGDLYCRECGRGHDRAEIEAEEAYYDEFGGGEAGDE